VGALELIQLEAVELVEQAELLQPQVQQEQPALF
jgi:hypothetical protein